MKFNQERDFTLYSIYAYDNEATQVVTPHADHQEDQNNDPNLVRLTSSFIISAHKLIKNWMPSRADQLSPADLDLITQLQPEVILLGTGRQLQFPELSVIAPIQAAGMGVEVMDSAAACRTYNILVNEGRYAAAGIIVN